MTQERARHVPLFARLPDDQLAQLWAQGEEIRFEAGEALFEEGDPPRGLYVLLDGKLKVTKQVGDETVLLATYDPGAFVGEISLLTGSPHNATVKAASPSHILKFHAALFNDLKASPIVGLMVATMAERLRTTEVMVQQHEKLSSLGKMSAGLAHELNNPASASLRAARQMPEKLGVVQELVLKLNQLGLSFDQLEYLRAFQETVMARAQNPRLLDSLERSDSEEVLISWLEEQGIDEAWRLASGLLAADLSTDELEDLRDTVGDDALDVALTWVEGILAVLELLHLIENSNTRILDLVQSVKSYTYMDTRSAQDVNIHEGLESTLTMLGHKLKNITVTRQYDRTLPPIRGFGSELNQVWTNIIDNAAGAMEGQGKLTVRTSRDGEYAQVEIGDNGPGIPTEIQARIFEPFFTTKKVGEGTGMGLDISHKIIVEHHHGTIRVESEPGSTRFIVQLPLNDAEPPA